MPDFIYPRDFFEQNQAKESVPAAFVLMPFRDEYRHIYDGAIKPSVEELGLTCLRADDIYSPRPILVTVMEQMARSSLLIADLTERNPNVFYEVGIAHVVRENERAILLSQSTDDVPFDLRHLRLIIYDGSAEGLRRLGADLQKAIRVLGLAIVPHSPSTEVQPEVADHEAPGSDARRSGPPAWGWVSATVSFRMGDARFSEISGRFAAALVRWFKYEDLQLSQRALEFPKGVLRYNGLSLNLILTPDAEELVSDLIRSVDLPFGAISFESDVPFEPGSMIGDIQTVGLPISFVSADQITIIADPQLGLGFVDLTANNGLTTVRLRASEDRPFRPSGGGLRFEDLAGFLLGRVSQKDMSSVLFKMCFG